MKSNEEVIAKQIRLLTETIEQLLPKGAHYALLDFPDHSNVGDSAIWLGEIKLLSQITGYMPSYVSTVEIYNKEKLKQALPDGPILIHGGGNFGDIWRHHQDFREKILCEFKDRLVIQLPQSIKFNDAKSIEACAKIIAQHSNFHLLVRDEQSLALAQQHFQCTTVLVPDAAFAIGALERPIAPINDIFMLLRTDSEKATYDQTPFKTVHALSADWLDEPVAFRRISKARAVLKALFNGVFSKQHRRLLYFQILATGRLNRGLKMLSSGKYVITDRLHAHILSTLLDIPHVALDNNYGKISGYIKAWTSECRNVKTATSANEAIQKVRSF